MARRLPRLPATGAWPYYDDYNALLAAPGEGWTVGKDVYGDVTYIKAYAASDSNSTYTLEGSSPVDADGRPTKRSMLPFLALLQTRRPL